MMSLRTTAWRLRFWLCLSCSFFVAHSALAAGVLAMTDDDGISDAWEMEVYHTDPAQADTDGDGVSDLQEIESGTNPLGKGAWKDSDFDKDGLSDRLELLFGTDPTNPDTDGDSFSDGKEIDAAFSPTSTGDVHLVKSIQIVLAEQKLEQQVMGISVSSFPMSSGLPKTPTPPGVYKVLSKHPRAWSSSAKLWMPWWMAFSKRGYGVHELPEWPGGRKEGANHLGHPASHGCVRLGIGAAKKVYEWAPVDTKITIVKTRPSVSSTILAKVEAKR